MIASLSINQFELKSIFSLKSNVRSMSAKHSLITSYPLMSPFRNIGINIVLWSLSEVLTLFITLGSPDLISTFGYLAYSHLSSTIILKHSILV